MAKEWVHVESSNLQAIGYDDLPMDITIRFLKGGDYVYHAVPFSVVMRLLQASSKGSFLASRIKGHYDYTKLEPAPAAVVVGEGTG